MRITIKFGTSSLAYASGNLKIKQVEELIKVICDIKNSGHEIILVSSGAIALGLGKINMSTRPTDIPSLQAASAVGQGELMYIYDKMFGEYNHVLGQLLLTGSDLEDPIRSENIGNMLRRLLELNVIPVINENDAIATEEIAVGDNDTLSATVACYSQSDLLILVSDIDGMYTANPAVDKNATLITDIYEINEDIESIAGDRGSILGTGGMITKVKAAKIAALKGIDTVIMNSSSPKLLYDVVNGKPAGTRFHAKK